jgi:hypothetical protein
VCGSHLFRVCPRTYKNQCIPLVLRCLFSEKYPLVHPCEIPLL